MRLLLYCVTIIIISLSFAHNLIDIFHISFLYTKYNPTHEDHLKRSDNNAPIPIYPKNPVTLLDKNGPSRIFLSKVVNNNITLNLNIASYFLNILVYPYVLTWFITGVPRTKTIEHPGLKKITKRQ